MGYLDYAGLQYLWGKLKEKFAPKSHTHDDRYYTESEMDGKLNSKVNNNEEGANGLLSKLTTSWTATPTDNTYFIRQDTGGGNSFGRVKFSTLWNYIKGKADGVYQPKGSYAASSHTHDDRYYTESEINTKLSGYLPTSGGTMGGTAKISWPDSGNWSKKNDGVTFPVKRGGLSWTGQSDGIDLYGEETGNDNLDLVLKFTDDNSNSLRIVNASGTILPQLLQKMKVMLLVPVQPIHLLLALAIQRPRQNSHLLLVLQHSLFISRTVNLLLEHILLEMHQAKRFVHWALLEIPAGQIKQRMISISLRCLLWLIGMAHTAEHLQTCNTVTVVDLARS